MDLWILRVQFKGLLIFIERLFEEVPFRVEVSEIVVRSRVIGVEFNRFLELLNGLIDQAQSNIDSAQVIPCLNEIGMEAAAPSYNISPPDHNPWQGRRSGLNGNRHRNYEGKRGWHAQNNRTPLPSLSSPHRLFPF